MTEEVKEISKKEAKRLAKQAEKKAQKAGASNDNAASVSVKNVPAETVKSSAPKEVIFFLANASNENCGASLKAAISASAFGVQLSRATNAHKLPCIFTGPALFSSSNSSVVAFGGNGTAKAIALIGSHSYDKAAVVDEWLEVERNSLRKDADAKIKAAALAKIDDVLSKGNGSFLVGDSLTVADIAVIVTLSQQDGDYSDAIKHYIKLHENSHCWVQGKLDLEGLVPPAPFDIKNDPSMIGAVNSIFVEAISNLLPEVAHTLGQVVEKSKQLKLGDYQCSKAMPLFAQLKGKGSLPTGVNSPQQLAQAIIASIPESNPVVDSLDMNGPGFILCKVKASYLEHHVNSLMNSAEEGKDPKLKLPKNIVKEDETVIVDFSSPNIAKEMHVGHLRSTIIGESVCRILEFVGANVKRVNHVGDWGTQFGMLIQYLKEAYPNFGKGEDINIGDLTQFYKKAKARFDEDEEFKETSRLNVVKLQAGDEECRLIWQILCDISRKEFEKVYKRLDITLEECGESFYNSKIPETIEEFNKAGLLRVEEGGARCVFVPKYKIPLMLQKSDGGYGYDSTDMTAIKYRLEELKGTRLVYITDFSQGDHFQMCFSAAEMIGWTDPKKHKLEHIGFGTVMGEDGKRFKTRSGDTVRLVDLLDEAVKRMEESLSDRIPADQVHSVASAMGYGAVKYFDLRRNPTSNYKFSYDQMLDTKGNTAIYLLYAHARLESIIDKGKNDFNVDVDDLINKKSAKIHIGHPSERNLALHIQMFSDSIVEVLEDLYPYRVCDFLYALSNAVSDFVTQCKVIGSPEMESRLLLCRASAVVMRQCFDLLGIQHVKRI
jgi:arginyl-tRNA synthetase